MEGLKCYDGTCEDEEGQGDAPDGPVDDGGSGGIGAADIPPSECDGVPNPTKLWSDTTTWTSGVLPQAGEDVQCESCATIILDVDTPCLNLLIVNCKLVFDN